MTVASSRWVYARFVPIRKENEVPGLTRKNFGTPDETRPFEEGTGKLEVINTESGVVGRATVEPGWHWSKHAKRIAGTESCQPAHTGYCGWSRMTAVMDDGAELEARRG